MNRQVFCKLADCAESGMSADIITIVSTPPDKIHNTGNMLVMVAGITEGQLLDEAFTKLVIEKVTESEWIKPILFDVMYQEKPYRLFWDKLSRRRSALVLGAGHISQPLTELLAKLDYAVTVVDDRPDFANGRRFPQAEQVVCKEFARALETLSLSSYDAIIVITRGHRWDIECLREVIAQPAAYIGMIGSQGRVRVVINTLQAEGVDSHALSRLRAPIGLDIGAETPVEIALSIAAEMVAVNRNAGCKPLSDKWRCKHA